MAEYINYGDQQIDQQALLTAMADNVQSYVNSQTWSNKRKEKFLNAYQDMLSGGIKGASIENGTWGINIGKNIDLNTKGKKDREMYQEAAYFIQNQMRNLLPKAEEEKKPEEKKEKEVFDFNKHFGQALLNSFGGSKETLEKNWESLDSAQDNGLFSRTGRAAKIKQALQSLKNSIKEEDYNFEKSSYGSHKNFTDKLNAAINALDNPDTARDALLSLGVNYNKLLDDYGTQKITLSDGSEITRADYAAQKAKQQEDEQLKVAKQEALVKQGNIGVVTHTSGIHGTDVRTQPEAYSQYLAKTYGTGQQGFNRINQEIQGLLNKAYNNGGGNGLTAEEKRKLGNFLFYIRANNPNSKAGNWNITPQEWEQLRWSKYAISQNQNDYIRLPWQIDGRYTFADNQGNIFFVKTSGHQKIDFNRSKNYNNYKNNFLKSQNTKALNTTIGNNKGLTDDMKADLTAMGLDLVSAGSAFVPGYGTAVSAVTGIGATLSGAVADRMRGESWGSTLGTAGFGLTMDVLGLIPGLGVAGKAAKIARIVSKGAKWVGPALGGLSAMAYGPGALSAYKKMVSGNSDDVTAEELRDFTYAIRAIAAGGIRKTGVTYQGNRTLARAQKAGRASITSAKESASITTKNGQQIKLTDEEFKTLSSNASRENKTKIISEAAKREKINMEGDEIEWKGINPVKGRFIPSSKSSKLSGLNKPLEASQLKWNTTNADYRGIKRFSNENFLRNYTQIGGSGIWQSFKDRWTGRDILNSTTTNNITSKQNFSEILGLPRKPYISPKYRTQELIPKERRLPEKLNTKGIVDVQKINSRPKSNLSIRESQKEINNWIDSYGLNSKRSKFSSIKGEYDSSKPLENGIYNYEIPTSSGEKIPITLNKSNDGITVILKGKSKSFKRIEEARQYMSQQIYDLTKNVNYTEIAQTLKEIKRTKGLKQGGTIDKQRIQKYKEYIKK